MSRAEELKALGNSAVNKPLYEQTEVNSDLLETFPTPFSQFLDASKTDTGPARAECTVSITAPEFTSLCPITGQPDFATIKVRYIPNRVCVESKSFKLYLGSFRNVGQFHEACIDRIANDLILLLHPIWIEVIGEFTPRGGIAFHPRVVWKNPIV